MSDTHVMDTDTTTDGNPQVSPEDQQLIRQTFGFLRGIVANPDLANDIPQGANVVLIPDDDPELAAAEVEAGMLALSRGQDVYFRHIRPGDIIRGAERAAIIRSGRQRVQSPRMETTPPEATVQSDLTDSPLTAIVRDEIAAAGGRITFARFMELALYHPQHGYYLSAERRPGRGGDFLTAPETHPFFGITIARQISEMWDRLGQPAEFTIREYGAGVGGLAYDILAGLADASPHLAGIVRYRLIEPNPYRRAEAMAAMREVGLDRQVATEAVDSTGQSEPITGVIIANEVADAFPVHRLVWRDDPRPGLRERYVTWGDDTFAEEEGDLSPAALASDPAGTLRAAGVILAAGDEIETSPAAATWLTAAARGLGRGYLLVLDYGYEAAELYRGHRLGGTLRAYYQHTVSDDPFRHLGRQDLTAHVDFTALRRAGEAAGLTLAGFTTQGAFLSSLGLGDLLVRMQTEPGVTAQAYLDTQAAVFRLIDPGGMGRFGVLIMARDTQVAPPLRGFAVAPPNF